MIFLSILHNFRLFGFRVFLFLDDSDNIIDGYDSNIFAESWLWGK